MILLQSEGRTKSLRLADNIDLIAGSKAKLTDHITSRLTYQHRFCVEVGLRIEPNKDMVYLPPGKGHPAQEITLEDRRWMR